MWGMMLGLEAPARVRAESHLEVIWKLIDEGEAVLRGGNEAGYI